MVCESSYDAHYYANSHDTPSQLNKRTAHTQVVPHRRLKRERTPKRLRGAPLRAASKTTASGVPFGELSLFQGI